MLRLTRPFALLAALLFVTVSSTTAAPAQQVCGPGAALGDMDTAAAADPHLELSALLRARPGDEGRAHDLARRTARAIAPYRDVARARGDGYRPFGDVPEAQVIHYVSLSRSLRERWRLDPERPGALLYERRNGDLVLVGAMFGAPGGASHSELDRRVPLSQARWHRHTNICTPRPIWSRTKWARRDAKGRMVYGAFSPIATKAACEAVGGRFHARILGWMVHVYPFDADPERWWR